MASRAVVIVTGANKGIGYAVVRKLALNHPASALASSLTPSSSPSPSPPSPPLLIYLTARDRSRGEAAAASIHQDDELARPGGPLEQGLVHVRFHQLDVASDESVERFGQFIAREHAGGVDVLVNNAGIGFGSGDVEGTLRCNYHGLVRTTRAILPSLRRDSRIVNVASMLGMLSRYSPSVAGRFRDARAESEVTALMDEFASGTVAGFPHSAYDVSKAGVIAFTRALAAELDGDETRRGRTLVNCCCPGYARTDMTGGRGVTTADEAAEAPVMLSLGDLSGRSGGYFTKRGEQEW